MKSLRTWVLSGLLYFFVVSLSSASTANETPGRFTPDEIAGFSKKVERVLAAKGARVFIIGRIGRAPASLPKGIRYTHAGLGVYTTIEREDGTRAPGYAIHNLYQDAENPERSQLLTDFPADFLAGAHVLKAGIIVPRPKLQHALLALFKHRDHLHLHNPAYSLLSNPANSRYQNCNEYVLDLLQAAIYDTVQVREIKENNRTYFKPQRVDVHGMKLFLGKLFRSDIKTDDHNGPIATATFTTIRNYLARYGLTEEAFEILPGSRLPEMH